MTMTTPSTCRLQITFAGLCLFVPDSGNRVFRVLMPDGEACGVMRHSARIVFSGDYFGSTQREYSILLQPVQRDLDLSGITSLGNPMATPALPPELVNVGSLGGSGVKPDNLTGTFSKYLAARLIIAGDVTIEPFNTADIGYAAPGNCKAAIRKTTAGGATIVVPRAPLNASGELELTSGVKLSPVGGRIDLLVANLMEEDFEHPPKPHQDPMQSHFKAYYSLLANTPPADAPLPCPPIMTRGTPPASRLPFSMDPYTCMLGGGCPDGTDNC
jgi:hypothetical protein